MKAERQDVSLLGGSREFCDSGVLCDRHMIPVEIKKLLGVGEFESHGVRLGVLDEGAQVV